MIRYRVNGKYYRNLKELLVESPELEEEIERRIRWFSNNPNDTRLDNHDLKKKMKGKWAFRESEVRFLAIGGHKKVYGKIV